MSWPAFQTALEQIKADVIELLQTGKGCGHQKTESTCRNLLGLEASLWTFARAPDVVPDHNAAERPLRRAVIWRRKSFGTQSESGSRFVERILTTVATLRPQQRDVLDNLTLLGQPCEAVTSEARATCLLPVPP